MGLRAFVAKAFRIFRQHASHICKAREFVASSAGPKIYGRPAFAFSFVVLSYLSTVGLWWSLLDDFLFLFETLISVKFLAMHIPDVKVAGADRVLK